MAKVSSQGGLERLQKSIADMQTKRAAVGFFDTAHYTDGTPVAQVAIAQEFGIIDPPRSFMRSTIAEQKAAWQATLAQGSKRVMADKLTAEQMLSAFGQVVAGQIKEKIESIDSPELSDVTLFLRQNRIDKSLPANTSTKPLVDTGVLISSVDSKVESR